MKRKTFGVVFSVLLLLGGAVSLSLASSIPREKLGREEEISDKEIQQPSCEVDVYKRQDMRLAGGIVDWRGDIKRFSFHVIRSYCSVYTFPVLCPVTVEKLRKIVFQLVNDLHI